MEKVQAYRLTSDTVAWACGTKVFPVFGEVPDRLMARGRVIHKENCIAVAHPQGSKIVALPESILTPITAEIFASKKEFDKATAPVPMTDRIETCGDW